MGVKGDILNPLRQTTAPMVSRRRCAPLQPAIAHTTNCPEQVKGRVLTNEGNERNTSRSVCLSVLQAGSGGNPDLLRSTPTESQEGEVAHATDFFGSVDDGWEVDEMGRERYDDLEFDAPSVPAWSLVDVNRSNPGEAKEIEELLKEFADVFAVEIRSAPARVEPFILELDVVEWEKIGNGQALAALTFRSKK